MFVDEGSASWDSDASAKKSVHKHIVLMKERERGERRGNEREGKGGEMREREEKKVREGEWMVEKEEEVR